jgi:hypothetical protein
MGSQGQFIATSLTRVPEYLFLTYIIYKYTGNGNGIGMIESRDESLQYTQFR